MRILIGAVNYPKPSETYLEAEVSYHRAAGHEVKVWSPVNGCPEAAAPEVQVYRGSAPEAFADFHPTVFHVHYLVFDRPPIDQAAQAGIPVTMRAHSFDWDRSRAIAWTEHPGVQRIWAFPRFAAEAKHPKIHPLPVAFDGALYQEEPEKDRHLVYRTAAAKPGKGLEDFFRVKALSQGFRFTLAVDPVGGEGAYYRHLEAECGDGIRFIGSPGVGAAVSRMKEAGIYLDTSDPAGHAFGMPISIAEAMATGCLVLAREAEGLKDYLGDAGLVYRTVEEAAELIKMTEKWTSFEWASVSRAAVAQASKFRSDAVLPAQAAFWKGL